MATIPSKSSLAISSGLQRLASRQWRGSILVGGTFLGLFGAEPGSSVLASVQPDELWQRPPGGSKGDFYRQLTEAVVSPAGADGLAVTGSGDKTGELVLPARAL